MNSPVQDPFWTETATFVRNSIGPDAPVIGPREFRSILPKIFSYDWVHAIEVLDQFGGIIIHKGLLHELPLPVLLTVKKEWKCVFANEVFLFFVPPNAAFPATDETHLQHFHECLESMERLTAIQKSRIKEFTALLVIASHTPAHLEKTLLSLSLLHLPILVVAATADATLRKSYFPICSLYRAEMLESYTGADTAEALETGVQRLLENPDITWISSFDDTLVVRPDFLFVMERFRDAERYPVLSGLWAEADGIGETFTRDGIRLVISRQQPRTHAYGHRNYWEQRISLSQKGKAFPQKLRSAAPLVIRDLVAIQR